MKFCAKCGKEIMDEAIICPGCGCAVNFFIKKQTVCSATKKPSSIIFSNSIEKHMDSIRKICLLMLSSILFTAVLCSCGVEDENWEQNITQPIVETTIPKKLKNDSTELNEEMSGYSEGLVFEKNVGGYSWMLAGIGTCQDPEIIVPPEYQGLPVTAVKEDAFEDQIGFSSITLPSSVTEIQDGAFSGCKGLTNIEFPGVKAIRGMAFSGCDNLTKITIPNSVEHISQRSFGFNHSLFEVIIEHFSHDMGFGCFEDCEGLRRVTILDGSTGIPDWAFYESGLKYIEIPKSVTVIGENAFYGCYSLDIIYNGTIEEWEKIYKADKMFSYNSYAIVYCTDGAVQQGNNQ